MSGILPVVAGHVVQVVHVLIYFLRGSGLFVCGNGDLHREGMARH